MKAASGGSRPGAVCSLQRSAATQPVRPRLCFLYTHMQMQPTMQKQHMHTTTCSYGRMYTFPGCSSESETCLSHACSFSYSYNQPQRSIILMVLWEKKNHCMDIVPLEQYWYQVPRTVIPCCIEVHINSYTCLKVLGWDEGQSVNGWGLVTCLTSSTSIDNGFHKDAQVGVVFLGPIALDADSQACWARVIQWNLKGQKLLCTIRG